VRRHLGPAAGYLSGMKVNRFAPRLAAAVLVCLANRLPAQSPAETAYERVARAWRSTQSLEARFDQRITNPLLGRTVTSRGLFQQQRPDRVSITFTDPAGDRIVGDGRSLWVYLPSTSPGQVLKLPASADGAIVADLLGLLLETPRQAFVITGGEAATIEGESTQRVQLVPRAAGSIPFQKATLWLSERRPVRLQVIDAQGIDRLITLTSWATDASIPRDAFTFKVPKGVKVLTKLPGAT